MIYLENINVNVAATCLQLQILFDYCLIVLVCVEHKDIVHINSLLSVSNISPSGR